MPGRTVYLETMGCQMNVLDSELVLGQLRALGYTPIDQMTEDELVALLGGEQDPERLREIAAGKSTKLH